jgi:hypothetical protein
MTGLMKRLEKQAIGGGEGLRFFGLNVMVRVCD